MPSPHTLGSIMHQPLAALTPLLLFPLENRTSTHPPSTPVSPPHPTGRPLSLRLPPRPLSRCGSLLVAVSLAFVRQSSTAGTATLLHPALHHLRHPQNPISVLHRGRLSSHLARTISATPSRRRSSSRRFCLSCSLFLFSSFLSYSLLPFLVLTSLSLASLEETDLVFVAISVSSSSSLRICHCYRRRLRRRCRRRRSGAPLSGFGTLFVVSPLYSSRFNQPVLSPFSIHYTSTQALQYTYTHIEIPFVHLLLADYLPRSFFTLSQPCLRPSVSAFRSSSSASLLSHHCPENPPFPTHRISLQGRPASIHAADPPPPSPLVAEGRRRTGIGSLSSL